jgi:hypothetical protein
LPVAIAPCYRVGQRHGEQPAGEGEMRFGFFDQLPCAAGFSEQQRYRDIMAQIVLGDELGFDGSANFISAGPSRSLPTR